MNHSDTLIAEMYNVYASKLLQVLQRFLFQINASIFY